MSGGEGLRAPGCFPPPAATVADAREACLFAGSGGRGEGRRGGDTARSAARAFPRGGGDKPRSPRSAGVSVDRRPGLALCVEAYSGCLGGVSFPITRRKEVWGPRATGLQQSPVLSD